jgi:hypothetical protein
VFTFSIVLSHGRDHIHPADVANRLPVLACRESVPRRSHARRLSRMPHAAQLTVAHAYLWPLASALGCRRAREISALEWNENDMALGERAASEPITGWTLQYFPKCVRLVGGSHLRTRMCGLPPGSACASSTRSSSSWRFSRVSRAPGQAPRDPARRTVGRPSRPDSPEVQAPSPPRPHDYGCTGVEPSIAIPRAESRRPTYLAARTGSGLRVIPRGQVHREASLGMAMGSGATRSLP